MGNVNLTPRQQPFPRLAVLSFVAGLAGLVSAQDNQCFHYANKRAGSIIVPCSTVGGYASCCQLGDICLSDCTCWNPTYNVTYLYGCTDPSYTQYTCPYKCGATFADAPYVDLDYCSNTTHFQWSCTHPKNSDAAIQPFDFAAPCLNDSKLAFGGEKSLPPYLSLPQTIGGSTLYFSPTAGSYTPVTGYTPTTAIHIAASASTSTPPTAAPSLTSSKSSADVGNGTTNTGVKIGLGIGVAGGVLLFAALILFFLMWHRRRQRYVVVPQHEVDDGEELHGAPKEKKSSRDRGGLPARGGRSGHQPRPSELAAEDVNGYGKPVYSEFEGSPVPSHTSLPTAPRMFELG